MTTLHDSAQKQLRQLVEQIERLDEERKGIAADIADKFAEAKAMGFDVKAMRQVIRLRKKSKTERDEEEAVLEAYLGALGMLADTPLGDYAVVEARKSHRKLKSMLDEDGSTATVRFGDGPEIPL